MKKTISLLIALSLSVFIAVACTSSQSSETDQSENLNSDTVLDNQLFKEATSSNSMEECDQILDKGLKEECKMTVESSVLTNQAVEEMDKSICDGIQLNRYKENCNNKTQEAIDDQNRAEEIISIGEKAIETENADICNDIEDENVKASCKYNVIANKAIETNDPSLCDEIENESSIKICKQNIPTDN